MVDSSPRSFVAPRPFSSCRQPQDDIQRIIHRSSYSRRRRQVANLFLSFSPCQGYREVGTGKSITEALSSTTIVISHGSDVFTGRPGERTSGLDYEAARLDLYEEGIFSLSIGESLLPVI